MNFKFYINTKLTSARPFSSNKAVLTLTSDLKLNELNNNSIKLANRKQEIVEYLSNNDPIVHNFTEIYGKKASNIKALKSENYEQELGNCLDNYYSRNRIVDNKVVEYYNSQEIDT